MLRTIDAINILDSKVANNSPEDRVKFLSGSDQADAIKFVIEILSEDGHINQNALTSLPALAMGAGGAYLEKELFYGIGIPVSNVTLLDKKFPRSNNDGYRYLEIDIAAYAKSALDNSNEINKYGFITFFGLEYIFVDKNYERAIFFLLSQILHDDGIIIISPVNTSTLKLKSYKEFGLVTIDDKINGILILKKTQS